MFFEKIFFIKFCDAFFQSQTYISHFSGMIGPTDVNKKEVHNNKWCVEVDIA